MRTLIYDTETTGKMNFKADPSGPGQPYLVQLAALLYEGRELAASINVLCCPTDANGVVVRHASALSPGDTVAVTLADGRFDAQVTGIDPTR